MKTTEKAECSWEQLFTPSLCSFVPRSPRLPLGASQHLFYWPLLCVSEQIGFYSQVRVEDKCECSITFCISLELSGYQEVLCLSAVFTVRTREHRMQLIPSALLIITFSLII